MEPWERKPDESPQAYAAALMYFELGPDRSLQAVAEKLTPTRKASKGRQKGVRVPGHIYRWSKQFEWPERAKAYDDRDNRIRSVATAQVVEARAKSDVETALERQALLRERHWDIYQQVTARLVKALRDDPDRVEGLDALLATYIKAMPVGDRAVAMALPNGVAPDAPKPEAAAQQSNAAVRAGLIAAVKHDMTKEQGT